MARIQHIQFSKSLNMDDTLRDQITAALAALIRDVMPDASFHEKYGGIVARRPQDKPTTQVCGYYAYQHHVALVFTQGARLDDPDHLLEGSGKLRRQIRLESCEDIETKRCRAFLEQAFGL